jgi:hypothetical protein
VVTELVPPLTGEEVEHYGWLLGGLLDGAFALAVVETRELSSVPRAIDAARTLVDELIARIPTEDS